MKQTEEQKFSEVNEGKRTPPPKGTWIAANAALLKEMAEEMEKLNPYLRGGSRCLYADDILHKELNNGKEK